jgi:RNA 3'-terminal phosphate cyclase (ATP)
MGALVKVELERPGFFPAGGGRWRARITPSTALRPLHLEARGAVRARRVRALVAQLPASIGEREIDVVAHKLAVDRSACEVVELRGGAGPGNAVVVDIESEHVTEVFTGFGARGVPAEAVATRCAEEAKAYLRAEVPVGLHLADQLVLYLALAGGGVFVTQAPTPHTLTNIAVIQEFLSVPLRADVSAAGRARIVAG